MQSPMKMIRGEVTRIVHHNHETGFLVFGIRLESGGKLSAGRFSCAGVDDEAPPVGSMVEVYGTISTSQYGPQMKFTAYHIIGGGSSLSLARYLISFAKFLGTEKAFAIAKHFGPSLEKVLDEEPDRLLEVDGIGQTIRDNIVEGWTSNRSVHNIKMFLSSIGLPDYKIRQVVAHHGPEYDSVIKQDPYVLMAEGIGFSICDSIAEKLEKTPDCDERKRGIIMHTILSETIMGNGHLFIDQKTLINSINNFNSDQRPGWKVDPIGVTWESMKGCVENLVENGFIVQEGDSYYPINQYYYEGKSAELLSEIIKSDGDPKLLGTSPDSLVDYFQAHERIKIPDFKFSDNQARAIEALVKDKVMVVTGPPGTGKTTVIKTFVRILDKNEVTYTLLAPTGIASKRLEQTSGKSASTIHRKLGYMGTSWRHHAGNKLSSSVFIVDEFSMVDMELFYRLISAIPSKSHLILVGDVFQLPSVGPGNVLRDMIKSGKITTITLDKIHRQAEKSDIILAANRIKDGDTNLDLFKEDIKADIVLAKTGTDIMAGQKVITDIAKSLIKNPDLTFQVITPRNSGDLSVDSINELLQHELNPATGNVGEGSVPQIRLDKDNVLRPRDKVIVLKNNYNLGVFNGDVGYIKYITSEVVRLELLSGETVALPIANARETLKLAYAVTVHKCLPLDAPVTTAFGPVSVGSLNKDDLILDESGKEQKVELVTRTGKKPVVEIRTESGRLYRSSGEHRHKVHIHGFKEAQDIKVGDHLCLSRAMHSGRSFVTGFVPFGNFPLADGEGLNLPDLCDEDTAWMLGALIGCGIISDEKTGNICVPPGIPKQAYRWFKGILCKWGINYMEDKNKGLSFTSVPVRQMLHFYGLGFWKPNKKRVPARVFSMEINLRRKFIEGIYDVADIHDQALARVSFLSNKLARDVLSLLTGLDSISYIKKDAKGYRVHLSRVFFLARIPFQSQNDIDLYPCPEGFLSDFLSFVQEKGIDMVKAQRHLQNFQRSGGEYIQLSLLKRIEVALKKRNLSYPGLKEILSKNYLYDRVKSIKNVGAEEMVDIAVSGPDHTFLMDGLITHNSQGTEYPVVILPLLKAHGNMLLQRNLLYTALTRARKKVIVVGQPAAIGTAIANAEIRYRNTKFAERLAECVDDYQQNSSRYSKKILTFSKEATNAPAIKKLVGQE